MCGSGPRQLARYLVVLKRESHSGEQLWRLGLHHAHDFPVASHERSGLVCTSAREPEPQVNWHPEAQSALWLTPPPIWSPARTHRLRERFVRRPLAKKRPSYPAATTYVSTAAATRGSIPAVSGG